MEVKLLVYFESSNTLRLCMVQVSYNTRLRSLRIHSLWPSALGCVYHVETAYTYLVM